MEQKHITVDFSQTVGSVKPMHSVNNGPALSRSLSNYEAFKAAEVPLVRTHDAAFCPTYGGQHTVDIMNIFPDFDADENDPASYDFTLTDEYMESILSVGSGVFYRLGNKIEHESKRYGALPPKDYGKWARICEHIIRHMNEGWAEGHHYGITYWEIWNEPDLHPQCWDAANEEFYPLFDTAARHLKACFPELKIGGPAVTGVYNSAFLRGFFDYLTRDPADPTPLDFFSFHRYAFDPHAYGDDSRLARKLLDSYGYTKTETILNEWNYVKRWDDILPSYYTIPSLKGSAFIAGAMIEAQHSPLDHFMYYDARLSTKWNGLYDAFSLAPLKTYRAMYAFKELYRLGGEVCCTSDDRNVMAMAAVSADRRGAAVLVTYYKDHDSLDGTGAEGETVELRLDWGGFASADGVRAEYLLIDREHDLEEASAETFFGETGAHILRLPLYTTVLVKLHRLTPADRLKLRPIEEGDRNALAEILTSGKVNQTYMIPDFDGMDDPKLAHLIERLTELSRDEKHYVRAMDVDGQLVGFLNDVAIDSGKIELGWVVHPSCHNRGYCTAAAKLAIRELFGRGFDTVTAGAFEENPASLRVMQKCGMTLTDQVDELEYRGRTHRVINYVITK